MKSMKLVKKILTAAVIVTTITNLNINFIENYNFTKVVYADEMQNQEVKYKIYANPRFGFKLSYPNIFSKSTESDNGDGVTLEAPDASCKLSIWGSYNVSSLTGNDLLESAKSRAAYISKEFSEKSFYRLQYSGGGDGEEITFYECGYIVGDKIMSYKISYPSSQKDKFSPITNYMTEDLLGNYYVMYDVNSDNYQDKGISINYPKVNIFSDKDKEDKINALIKSEALKPLEWWKNEDTEVTLNLDYTIKYKSDNILSIEYLGYGNVKGAVHPSNIIYTTNINMKDASLIKLNDILNIDASLIDALKKGNYQTYSEGLNLETAGALKEVKSSLSAKDLIEELKAEDSKFYFTKDSLGISVSVAHVVGDHVEFEIAYKNLLDNINDSNEILNEFILK